MVYIFITLDFNPRSPCGERRATNSSWYVLLYFNPRSPCGERHQRMIRMLDPTVFQSTLPVRGATQDTLPDYYG